MTPGRDEAPPGRDEAADLDDLRRRLYRDGATEADVLRYLDERSAVLPPDVPAAAPPTRPRRRRVAIVVGAGVLAVLGLTIGALRQQPAPAPPPSVATPAARAVLVDVGDGRLLSVAPGAAAGPTRTALLLGDATASAQRFEGVGNAVVRVELPAAAAGRERAVVVMAAERRTTARWRALRPVTRRDWYSYEQIVATGGITPGQGVGSPQPFEYAGEPPSSIAVEAPAGLHWTLIVAPVNDPTGGVR